MNHQHLILRAESNKTPKSTKELNKWLKELVLLINMQVLIKPSSKYLNEIGNKGMSGLIGLTTSHSSVHFWDEVYPYLIQMDLYSCKDFDTSKVISHLNYYNLVSYNYILVDRNNNIIITSSENRDVKYARNI